MLLALHLFAFMWAASTAIHFVLFLFIFTEPFNVKCFCMMPTENAWLKLAVTNIKSEWERELGLQITNNTWDSIWEHVCTCSLNARHRVIQFKVHIESFFKSEVTRHFSWYFTTMWWIWVYRCWSAAQFSHVCQIARLLGWHFQFILKNI